MIKSTAALEELRLKLQRANEIISNIAANEKYITPVTLEDQQLFEDFFAKEERHTYGNSWIYVTQGVFGIGPNDLGYKYYDGENLCMLGISPKIEQPDIIMLYWIRPLGQSILEVIADYAERIREKYGVASYVKKLFHDQFEFLVKKGFRSSREFPWHNSAHSEDDTYPELIYDRLITLNIVKQASRSSTLGRVKRGVAKVKKGNELEIVDIDFKEKAWVVIENYFWERNKLLEKINISTPLDYYNMIFRNHDTSVEKKVLLANKDPVGVYIIEHNKKFNTINMYCCFTLKQCYKYLTDALKLFIFEDKKSKYINCGGSEDKGILCFKNKYRPIIKKNMYWATNYL